LNQNRAAEFVLFRVTVNEFAERRRLSERAVSSQQRQNNRKNQPTNFVNGLHFVFVLKLLIAKDGVDRAFINKRDANFNFKPGDWLRPLISIRLPD
jgi:hypothetical protein